MRYLKLLFCLLPLSLFSQGLRFHMAKKHTCYASGKVENTRVPNQRQTLSGEPTAVITVAYNGFTPEAQAAFQFAVDIWARTITSEVPIRITANWSQLGDNVLGSASATSTVSNFENAPLKDVRYPLALAEKLARKQLNLPTQSEISANFSSEINWYFGTDANPAANQFDLVSVVLHEIGHGLGFSDSFGANSQVAVWGLDNTGQTNMPIIYDLYLQDQLGRKLIDESEFENNSEALLDAVTSNNVRYGSPLAQVAFGNFPPIFSPNPWNGGSSIAHLDEAVFAPGDPNSLMSPQFGLGEAIHLPGLVTEAIFSEMGWVHTFLSHEEVLFAETVDAPIDFQIQVESDSSLNTDRVELIVSSNNFESSTTYQLTQNISQNDLFEISVPYNEIGDVSQYYFRYTTPDDRVYLLPREGESEAFDLVKGVDSTTPEIVHAPSGFNLTENISLTFEVTDNFGLDTVFLEYKTSNSNTSQFVGLVASSEEESNYNYSTTRSDLSIGVNDTLLYKVHAIDKSINRNTRLFPSESFAKVVAVDLEDPLSNYQISFQSNQINDSIGLVNMVIEGGDGFNDIGLNTPHPYGNGYEGFSSMITKYPITLNQESVISFDEILMLEPTVDMGIRDFLMIEASANGGTSWISIGDSLNASDHEPWLTAFNADLDASGSNTVADQSLFRTRDIDLITTDLPFVVGDELIFRFTVVSNESINGWGVRLDNISLGRKIVTSINTPFDFKIYPNPVQDLLSIEIGMDNLEMIVRELSGKIVHREKLSPNATVDMRALNSGIYLIDVLNPEGKLLETQKIIKK